MYISFELLPHMLMDGSAHELAPTMHEVTTTNDYTRLANELYMSLLEQTGDVREILQNSIADGVILTVVRGRG